jgi:hypothetical protein
MAWDIDRLAALAKKLTPEQVPLEGRTHIAAIRFREDPEPDYVGVHPDDLPY